MRKLILILFIFLIFTLVYTQRDQGNKLSLVEKAQKRINSSPTKIYKDSMWNYTIYYPSCFKKVVTADDNISDGYVCFRYWDGAIINMEAFVFKSDSTKNFRSEIFQISSERHATKKMIGKDNFIISGPIYENNVEIPDYVYHAKYVRVCKMYIVYQLIYHKDYEKALINVIESIDNWTPYNKSEHFNDIFIPHRKSPEI